MSMTNGHLCGETSRIVDSECPARKCRRFVDGGFAIWNRGRIVDDPAHILYYDRNLAFDAR
jgi:hypothetical protein